MIKVRIEGKFYFYEPKTLHIYICKVFAGITYYTPLNYCDTRIKQFI